LIRAVLVRQGWITEADLPWIDEADRSFAASESHAFLVAFFAALPCPVWNTPTPTCLAGPAWRPIQWRQAARRIGLATAVGGPESDGSAVLVSVIGRRCVGAPDGVVADAARRLARSCATEMLALEFVAGSGELRLWNAHLWPDLADPAVAEATAAALREVT
jgi:hypothetical protein